MSVCTLIISSYDKKCGGLFIRKEETYVLSEVYDGVFILLLQYDHVFKEEKVPR